MPHNTNAATLSMSRPDGLLGGLFGRVAEAATTSFEEIMPVWTRDQLTRLMGYDTPYRPTFQETPTAEIKSGETLTTGAGGNTPDMSGNQSFVLSTNQILLLAGGGLLAMVMLSGD